MPFASRLKTSFFPDFVFPLRRNVLILARYVLASVGVITLGHAKADEVSSAAPVIVHLWPAGQIPGRADGLPEKGSPETGFTNVSDPTIAVYQVKRSQAGPAIVVCPGGGYKHLAYAKEGTEIARWLNSIGITAIVLKYRVPDNREGAAQDLERGLRLVRARAGDWNIDPARLGVMGFSAGGHLSAYVCTNSDKPAYPSFDAADKQSCRPDFAILVYPAYLNQGDQVAPELPISLNIPPTLIVHNEDDGFVRGSKAYHAALEAAKVPNTFLLYQTGGHGYGLHAKPDQGVYIWPKDCQSWLSQKGLCPPPAP